MNTYAPPLIDDPEKFLHTLLILGALANALERITKLEAR